MMMGRAPIFFSLIIRINSSLPFSLKKPNSGNERTNKKMMVAFYRRLQLLLVATTVLLNQLSYTIVAFTFQPTKVTRTMTGNNVVDGVSVVSMTSDPTAGGGATIPADDDNMNIDGTAGGDDSIESGSHDELMYTLGVNLARQLGDIRPLVENGEELSQVAQGLLDCVVGKLDDNAQRLLIAKRGKELDAIIVSRAKALQDKLEKRGREMLQNMAKNEGVQELESGVMLHVLEHGPEGKGEGPRPTKGSVVQIHYHGTLSDGTVFDSTLSGDPVNFPLAQVIPGWRDGVLAMHEGETAMLGIPPEQGYGAEGTPDGRIPGGSTLFFKIQLLKIMSGAVGGGPKLVDATGNALGGGGGGGGGLLGVDGKPLS